MDSTSASRLGPAFETGNSGSGAGVGGSAAQQQGLGGGFGSGSKYVSGDGFLQRPESSHGSIIEGFQFRPGPIRPARSIVGGGGKAFGAGGSIEENVAGGGQSNTAGTNHPFGGDIASLLMPPPPLPVRGGRRTISGDGVLVNGGRERGEQGGNGIGESTSEPMALKVRTDDMIPKEKTPTEQEQGIVLNRKRPWGSASRSSSGSGPSTPKRKISNTGSEKRAPLVDCNWDDSSGDSSTAPPPSSQPRPVAGGSSNSNWPDDLFDFGMPFDRVGAQQAAVTTPKSRPATQKPPRPQKERQLEIYEMPHAQIIEAKLKAAMEKRNERESKINNTGHVNSGAIVIDLDGDDDEDGHDTDHAQGVPPSSAHGMVRGLAGDKFNTPPVERNVRTVRNSDRDERARRGFPNQGTQKRLGPPVSRRPRPDTFDEEPNMAAPRPQFSKTGHVLASSQKLQSIMSDAEPEKPAQKPFAIDGPGPMSGAQQLTMALVQLTAEKTMLEESNQNLLRDYNSKHEELRAARAEILTLKQAAHKRTDMERDRFEEVTAGIMAEFSKLNRTIGEVRGDIQRLDQNDSEIAKQAAECIEQGNGIKDGLSSVRDDVLELQVHARQKELSDAVLKQVEVERDLALQARDQFKARLAEALERLEVTSSRVLSLEDLMAKGGERVEILLREEKEKVEALFEINQGGISDIITKSQELVDALHRASEEIKMDLTNMHTEAQSGGKLNMNLTLQATEQHLQTYSQALENTLVGQIHTASAEICQKVLGLSNTIQESHKSIIDETKDTRKAILNGQQMIIETAKNGYHGIREQLTSDFGSVSELVTTVLDEVKRGQMAASEQSQQLAQIQKEKEGLLSRIKTLDAVNQELIAIKTKNSMLTTSLEEQKKRREELKVALDSAKKLQDEALEKCGLLNTKLADDRVKYIERENELKQKLVEEKVELERIVALERNNVIILRKELEHLNSLPREDPASKQMLLELQFKVSSLETEKLSLQARVKDVEAREESKQTRIDNLTSTYDSLKEKYDQNTEKLQLLNNEKTALENTLSNLQSAHKKEMSEALKKAKEQYIAERIQVERNATTLLALARGERDQAIETRDKIQKELQQLLQSNELNEKEYARYKLTNDNLAESNRGLTERNTQLKAEVVALQEEKEAVSQARDQLKRELREAEEKIYSEALKSNQQKIEDAEEFKKLELNFKMVRMECDKLSKRFIDSQAQLQKLQSELDISRNTLQDRNSVATTLETKTLELNQALEACKRHWAFVVDLLFETHENKPLEINPGFEEVVMRLRLVLSHKALVTAPQESKTPHGNSGQNPAAAPVTPSVEVNGGTSNLVPAVTPLLINYDISCLQGEEPPTSSPLSPVPSNVSELALLGFPKNKELSMLPPAQFELPATPKYRVGDKEGSSVTVEVPQSSDLGLASSTTGNAGSDPIAPAMIPSTIVSGTSPISSRVKRGRAQAGDTEGVGNGGSSSSASHKVSLGKEMTSPSTKRKHTYKAPGEDRTSSTHLSKRVRKERDSETSRAEHRPDVQRTPKKGSSTLGDRHETHNNVREADVHHESPSRHASAGSKKLLSRAKARRG